MAKKTTRKTTKTQPKPGTKRGGGSRPKTQVAARPVDAAAVDDAEPEQLVKVNSAIVRRRQKARTAAGVPAVARSATAVPGGTKYRSGSDFVRHQPLDTPSRDVVEAGAKLGIKVTAGLVRVTRFKMRHEGGKRATAGIGTVRRGRPSKATGATPVRRGRPTAPSRKPPLGPSATEVQFRWLVIQVGTARANALVDEVAQRLEALISG